MKSKKNNIVLIGMPGCGKSTIGVVLAKILGYKFIDSDLLIQEKEQSLLSEIIKIKGADAFNHIENQVNAGIETERTVIATGGSAIYGKEAMEHLGEIGLIVYIKLPYEEIEKRLGDLSQRGISMKQGQNLKELYDERTPYYERYAHLEIETENMEIRDSAAFIKQEYEKSFC